jgi:hypothetical protein
MRSSLRLILCLFVLSIFAGVTARANEISNNENNSEVRDTDEVQGLYKALLYYEGTKLYQFANITLRTITTGSGQLKISANVRIAYGKQDSNEFFSYEFDDCPLNILTTQISMKSEKNTVSLVGFLKKGKLEGEWFSTIVGRVGKFVAIKGEDPKPPEDGVLVTSLTGHYKGSLENTNSQSNLPERVTMSLVTTQDTSGSEPVIKISGNTRLYLGDFGSLEYVETKLTDVQFNYFNRFLSAKTVDYGLTYKGYLSHEGVFTGLVYADGLGEAGKLNLTRVQ